MIITRTRAKPATRLKLIVLELATIADAIVYLASLTMLTSSLRSTVLFSEWMDD